MGFLLGIGAAQKAAAKSTDGKSTARRYPVISIVVVILLAAVDSWVARSGSEPPSSLSAADEGGAVALPQGMEV